MNCFLIPALLTGMLANASPRTYVAKNLTDTVSPKQVSAVTVDSSKKEYIGIDAEFPGGEKGWLSYIGANLNPTVPVVKGAPAGDYTVVVQFVVNQKGRVQDIKPLTAFGFGMEEEVVRVIGKSPTWRHAILDGKPVNVYRKQPVTFSVEERKKKKKLF